MDLLIEGAYMLAEIVLVYDEPTLVGELATILPSAGPDVAVFPEALAAVYAIETGIRL